MIPLHARKTRRSWKKLAVCDYVKDKLKASEKGPNENLIYCTSETTGKVSKLWELFDGKSQCSFSENNSINITSLCMTTYNGELNCDYTDIL